MSIFSVAASVYDSINGSQYETYACFLEEAFKRYSSAPVREVLDLGCGTGGITRLMANKGYDMIGADISTDMLSIAVGQNSTGDIRYICQDMRELDLYGTVQAVYSSFDCLNYLCNSAELDKVFSLIRNFTEPEGLFVFDINTPFRYENIFADNSYVYEFGKDMFVWQNHYNKSRKNCYFYLTLFSENDGLYTRIDETQKQCCFPVKTVIKLLEKNSFELKGIFGSSEFTPFSETSEKAFFVAVAK